MEPRESLEPQDRIDPMIGRRGGEWDRLVSGLPPVPVPWPPVGPIVVVAPHPDDELLAIGAGGFGVSGTPKQSMDIHHSR